MVRLCEDREDGPGQSSKKTRDLTDSLVWGIFWRAILILGARQIQTHRVRAKWLQSCPALGDPMDCNPLGSSVHGIL